MSVLKVIMLNPKTMNLVQIHENSDGGGQFTVAALGEGDTLGKSHIDDGEIPGYWRIHSPRGVAFAARGQGYGAALYMGTAVAVAPEDDEEYYGVHSFPGGRSESAARLWKTLIRNKVAQRIEEESNEPYTEDDYQYCAYVDGDRVEDGDRRGRVMDSEICGRVTVEWDSGMKEFDILNASTVRELGLVVLETSAATDDDDRTPVDLMVRIPVKRKEDAFVLAKILRDIYGINAMRAFVARPDIAELWGQGRLPGIAPKHFEPSEGNRWVKRPPPRPVVTSERDQRLVEAWKRLQWDAGLPVDGLGAAGSVVVPMPPITQRARSIAALSRLEWD